MSSVVAAKLLAIFVIITLGWVAGRTRLLGGEQSTKTVSNLAFFVFTPALLFRTTARIDLSTMPWTTIEVYFGPVVGLLLASYCWHRIRRPTDPAIPPVRAIATTFGNTVQLGVPVITALLGEAGLTIHVAIISLHALILLTTATVLVEMDLARSRTRGGAERPRVLATVGVTARRTVIHPVVLPVLLGLAWNLTGVSLPGGADEVLVILGQAVVPVCLVTIGMSLALYGVAGAVRAALVSTTGKLVVQPALVFSLAYFGAGLRGTPLIVAVTCAALPTGANALLFAQRYNSLEGETTTGIVISTLAFVATGPAWILLATHLA